MVSPTDVKGKEQDHYRYALDKIAEETVDSLMESPKGATLMPKSSVDEIFNHLSSISYKRDGDDMPILRIRGKEQAKAQLLELVLGCLPEKLPPSDPKYHNKWHKPEPRPPHKCDDGVDCEHYIVIPPKQTMTLVSYNDGFNAAIDLMETNLRKVFGDE